MECTVLGSGPLGSAPLGGDFGSAFDRGFDVGELADKIEAASPNASIELIGVVSAHGHSLLACWYKVTVPIWTNIVDFLGADWSRAKDKWEEIVAGAFDKAGYDEVILTPRSGDHGRDVIATKHGVGSVKILGSVKAYSPGRLVRHDDARALLGALGNERDASKGIIVTTSDFAPGISTDPFIEPSIPTRLELMNGDGLRSWLRDLRKRT
ncbi:MAG: restriction endonuclease [Bauldia sp.]